MDLTDLFIGMSTKQKQKTIKLDNNNFTIFPLDACFQEVRRLFVFVFGNTEESAKKVEINNHTKYFPPRVNIINYNVLIDRRNFYDQQINDTKKTIR